MYYIIIMYMEHPNNETFRALKLFHYVKVFFKDSVGKQVWTLD